MEESYFEIIEMQFNCKWTLPVPVLVFFIRFLSSLAKEHEKYLF